MVWYMVLGLILLLRADSIVARACRQKGSRIAPGGHVGNGRGDRSGHGTCGARASFGHSASPRCVCQSRAGFEPV
jgi:hypothetical protein